MAEEKKGCSDSSCSESSCSGCSHAEGGQAPEWGKTLESTHVKKVIGVVSGKGGVGKSMVTSLLASRMAKQGKSVAILDADATGPSIPRMLGVESKLFATIEGIVPSKSSEGIEVMSVNLMLPDETEPVIWRGPVISGIINQFWGETVWGDVDYMFVDMPPGTSDVPLTVFQTLPVDGIVVVASPQELVGMIVTKAVKLAEKMDIPILALVENMAYYVCPDCGKQHKIYGESHIDEIASQHNIDTVAKMPINPAFAAAADAGKVAEVDAPELDVIVEKIKTL